MAQPANTFDSFDAVGNREDLTDVIYNISPTDTPFMSNIGRSKVMATLHEWQTDNLAAVDTGNAQVEGDDEGGDAVTPTARPQNSTQISKKTVVVSGTQRVTNTAGRQNDELLYQLAKKGRELRRDMEAIMTGNQGRAAGNSTTARTLRSLESWYATNTNRGATGANGTDGAGATDGTQRAFTETLLKDVIKQVYDAGGNPTVIMLGSFNKQTASGFAGHTALETNAPPGGPRAIIGGMEIYVSDFGEMRFVPNRFQRDRTAHVLDTEFWATGFLRPFHTDTLAKSGDSEKRTLRAEYTLESRQEASSGVVADLNTA